MTTLGKAITSIRTLQDLTPFEFARRLGISKIKLRYVEEDRHTLSAEEAARWARTFGYPESLLVDLAGTLNNS